MRDGSSFDTLDFGAHHTSPTRIPGFLVAILLVVGPPFLRPADPTSNLPARGLVSDNWEQGLSFFGKIMDYLWPTSLCRFSASGTIASFGDADASNEELLLDEIKKQYVITRRRKGLSESRVIYGDIFRKRDALNTSPASRGCSFPRFFGACSIKKSRNGSSSLDGGSGGLGSRPRGAGLTPVIFGTLFAFGLHQPYRRDPVGPDVRVRSIRDDFETRES